MLAEIVADLLGAERLQHTSVFARIDVRDSTIRSRGDHVGNAVAVRVSGAFDAGAELIAGTTVGAPQQFAAPGRVHVDTAGVRAAIRGLRWRGGHEVGNAIAIDVADLPCDPSELIA